MNVAVTGGGGFVGRHVVKQLETLGISPTLVLRPGSTVPDQLSRHRVVRVDITAPPPNVYDRLGRPQVLIHLAWGGLPNYSSPHHIDQELPAQRSFLDRLITAGLGALTVTGTCLEYGMRSGALREDMPTAPVTTYGKAKDRLRAHLELVRGNLHFNLTWARLFYLYGQGQAPGSLLPQLEGAIARGDATFNMSGGNQLRDYLPIEEATKYLVSLALNGRDNGAVNVCSGRPVSVRELVEREVGRRGASIVLNFGRFPYPDYEPMAFWGERHKLDNLLEATHDAI